MSSPQITADTKLRLVILYGLRYEKLAGNALPMLVEMLKSEDGLSDRHIKLVEDVLQYAGADQRTEDIFANRNILARTTQVLKGLKVRENLYILFLV
jgi:vacuolar protein sorting-associated protein 45